MDCGERKTQNLVTSMAEYLAPQSIVGPRRVLQDTWTEKNDDNTCCDLLDEEKTTPKPKTAALLLLSFWALAG